MSDKNCNPLNSVYCNLKVKLAGTLSERTSTGSTAARCATNATLPASTGEPGK